jgi:hypothetical protein
MLAESCSRCSWLEPQGKSSSRMLAGWAEKATTAEVRSG